MKGYPIEDNSPVALMTGVEISGNVIPMEWFNHIKHANGKPHTTAIMILADIVYWYRPIEERDEKTGKVIGYRKKFEGDKLQRSYNAFAQLYGYTKNQIREAIDTLEKLGVITPEFRHPVVNGQKLGNVLYIGLEVDTLLKITQPLFNLNGTGHGKKQNTPPKKEPKTNTDTTDTEITEITTEIISLWASLFPNKPKPRVATVKEKVKTRWANLAFRDGWRRALETAGQSKTCQTESWFNFEFFVRNDANFQKMIDRWMDWKDKEKYSGNGKSNGTPALDPFAAARERYAQQ